MRGLVVGLAVGIGLIGTTPASAATPAQVVSKRLGQVYGVAWRHHTPAWSGTLYSVGGNLGSHVPTNQIRGGLLF